MNARSLIRPKLKYVYWPINKKSPRVLRMSRFRAPYQLGIGVNNNGATRPLCAEYSLPLPLVRKGWAVPFG